MEALHSLGIDWKMLIAQIINFLVLLFLLNKFLYKPILNMLESRKQKIEKGLEDAQHSAKILQNSKEEADKITEKAYQEAGEILNTAKLEAQKEAEEIVKKAKNQAEKINREAQIEAENYKTKAITEARKHLSEIISLSLSKVFKDKVDQKMKKHLTEEAMREIE